MKIALMGMLGFFVAACNVAYGQAKFYITAPKSVPVNQNFQVNVVLENANGSGLKAPSFNDFQLLSGPNTSTSMQWVNGNVTQSVTYSYILQPKQEGTFKIGKASIVVSGVTMESNELTVEVTKAAAQQQTQRRQRNPFDPFDDPFFHQDEDENQPQVSKADIEKQLKEDVFAKLILSRSAVYNGEMVTATYRLYFRRNLDQVGVTKAPAFDGFWSQEVDLDPKRRPTVETVNGRQYHVIDILKYNLYPQRSGNMPVAAAEISTVVEVQTQQPSFFNPFGRSEQLQMKVNSG
ncbi:MAG TPA: BatD family protein, partial [Chitinophagales bacterium]|nr:BatD family protein [Chitinophagales bacterium]